MSLDVPKTLLYGLDFGQEINACSLNFFPPLSSCPLSDKGKIILSFGGAHREADGVGKWLVQKSSRWMGELVGH